MSEACLLERLESLKLSLGNKLVRPEQVTSPGGLSTGWPELDCFLLWQGFPKGEVSLLCGPAGGATTLWQRSAAQITARGQWVAWVRDPETELTPWSLRKHKVDLAKLLCVSAPKNMKQLLWALQELMSLCLFEIIGCDLGAIELPPHQVLKLRKLALRYKTALVLFSSAPRVVLKASFYALILSFQKHQVIVQRALHRPTPHFFDRKDLYADTLPLLTAGRRAFCG